MINTDKKVNASFCGSIYRVASTAADSSFTGATINRLGYYDGVLTIPWAAALTSGKYLKATVTYQESADGNTWDTAVSLLASTTLGTGASGGSTPSGVIEQYLDLTGKKQYVRFNVTVGLEATATDTVTLAGAFVKSNSDTEPV